MQKVFQRHRPAGGFPGAARPARTARRCAVGHRRPTTPATTSDCPRCSSVAAPSRSSSTSSPSGSSACPGTLRPHPSLPRSDVPCTWTCPPRRRRCGGSCGQYFAELITEQDRRDLVDQTEGGPTFDRIYQRMGRDGWLGLGWPEEYGGRGEDPEALFVFYDEAIRAERPALVGHPQHRGAGADEVRHPGAEGLLPPADPGRRADLRDRLHRAGRRHRPRRPADAGRIDGDELSSTATRSSPVPASSPTGSGWPSGPTRTRRGTRASPSSWYRPRHRASRSRRSTRSAASAPPPPTTRTSGCRSQRGRRMNGGWR